MADLFRILKVDQTKKSKFDNLNRNLIIYILEYLKKGEYIKVLLLDKRINNIIQKYNRNMYKEFEKSKSFLKKRCSGFRHCKKKCIIEDNNKIHEEFCKFDPDLKIINLPELNKAVFNKCKFCFRIYCKKCSLENTKRCNITRCKKFICHYCLKKSTSSCSLCRKNLFCKLNKYGKEIKDYEFECLVCSAKICSGCKRSKLEYKGIYCKECFSKELFIRKLKVIKKKSKRRLSTKKQIESE
jgi:hypothetical protein